MFDVKMSQEDQNITRGSAPMFKVAHDNVKLGMLTVGKGTIRWAPPYHNSSYHLSWVEFAGMFEEYCRGKGQK